MQNKKPFEIILQKGELQAFKVGRVVKNRTFIYKGLTMTRFLTTQL